jgi:hypothetical protein
MKLENIKIGESYQLKTVKKSKESLGKFFSEYETEEIGDIICNTYDNDVYEYFCFSEHIVNIVMEKDLNDRKFDVKIKNAKGYTVWTNSNCLKKIK